MCPIISCPQSFPFLQSLRCTGFIEETFFNLFWPALVQFQAIVGKTFLNLFGFWGLKNVGPNPDDTL